MKPDPTIDAIREVRRQVSEAVGHDAHRLVQHYRQLQERHYDRVTTRNTEESNLKDQDAA